MQARQHVERAAASNASREPGATAPDDVESTPTALATLGDPLEMSRFVRASAYRHVYCDPPKAEDTYQVQ